MIETILGPLPVEQLDKRVVTHILQQGGHTTETQYWFAGQMVRNDLDIKLAGL